MDIKPHLACDGYKVSHKFQYPEDTTLVYSNMTARSAEHANMPNSWDRKIVFVGLQGFIKEFLIKAWNKGFFERPKDKVVTEYKRRMDNYLGPDAVPVDHIAALHDLGYLPLEIKALPEGSRVNLKVPFLTIQNTHPDFFWLTNYIETALSDELWKPITVATIAYEYRRILNKYVEMTGASKEFADWQLHDFSMRGMSGVADAAKCGAAHLMSAGFGTDTLPAIDYLEKYYGANSDKELVAGSVPATEHSVMCMGGSDNELETFKRLVTETYPSGIVSIVSDTWDFWNVITDTAVKLKDDILNRKPNALGMAKVVFRPDSGDPVKIVTGLTYTDITSVEEGINQYDLVTDINPDVVKYKDKYYTYTTDVEWIDSGYEEGFYTGHCVELEKEVPIHEVIGAVECLWNTFGGTTTDKGYKTLHERVGLIYGDSITLDRAEQILARLEAKGFSASNIVFGIGSYTYQYITRDTFGMAIKATYGEVNGKARELFKDPKTGDGIKKSAKGLLRVEKEGDDYVLYDQQTNTETLKGELKPVFCNVKLLFETNLQQIRERVKNG